jgi:hypothetical protein
MENLQVVWCAVHTTYHTRAAPTRIALAISPLPHPHNFVCTRICRQASDVCALEGGRQITPDLGH